MGLSTLKTWLLSVVWLSGSELSTLAVEKGSGIPMADPEFVSDQPDADGMLTALFHIPPQLAGGGDITESEAARRRHLAKDLLEKEGVLFRGSASATYYPGTSILMVHNTKDEIQKCAVFVGQIMGPWPVSIVRFKWRVLEVEEETWLKFGMGQPGKLPRVLSPDDLKKLQASPQSKNAVCLEGETRSGQRTQISTGADMQYVSGYTSESGHLVPEIRQQKTGLVIEFDPVCGGDGKVVDLNYQIDFDYLPPDVAKVSVGSSAKEKNQHAVDVITWHRDAFAGATSIDAGDTVVVAVSSVIADSTAKKIVEPRVRLFVLTVNQDFVRSK